MWIPEKWSSCENNPRKNGPRKKGPRENGSREKNPRKNGPRKIGLQKNRGVSVDHRAVCVWNVRMWSVYENPQHDNKPKTRKQKIVGWASSIVVCVCGMLGCDQSMETQKLDNKPSWTPLVFYRLLHVGLWDGCQPYFCVCSGINR